ncbi:MAG: DUF551 domain-containing protein [Pyrinomonadaceae bacterium MAG19_C2-C3]|nr:DUF551 domain-containing protein [Pyrinomonadaceae bacterium MAG19_C2-C3]
MFSREDKAFGFIADAVMHWMPLPEPPEQEQREP